jgi:hypothetical protein
MSNYDKQIAETILSQLGGQRFLAMTGAKNLAVMKNGLQMKINGRHPELGVKVNLVQITLNGSDLYDLNFGNVRADKLSVVKVLNDVYFDQLMDLFEANTGLYVTISPRRR